MMLAEVNSQNQRLMEVAASILNHVPDKKLKTVALNKALFYVDLVSLRDFGDTVSHNTYIALEHGPVIAKYPNRLVNGLVKAGIAIQSSEGNSKPIVLKQMPDRLDYIDVSIETVIEKVALWAARRTAQEMSDIAHQNIGWIVAYQEGLGRQQPAQPINLYLAMQQIVDPDPWLEMAYTASNQVMAAADCDAGIAW